MADKSAADFALLVEANQNLVIASLRAQHDADASAAALGELTRASDLDPLTRLPNRTRLFERIARAIVDCRREHTRFAVLFVDVNNFKKINDQLGHAAGDQVLMQAAQALAGCMRGTDSVSRYGGDEFVVVLGKIAHAADAVAAAERMIAALGRPHRQGDHVVRLTASIGISIYPDDGDDSASLLDSADLAMYQAKRRGLACFAFDGNRSRRAPILDAPPLESLLEPVMHVDLAQAEQERQNALLRESNQRLILAALNAQQLQDAAELANRALAGLLDVSQAGGDRLRLRRQLVELAGIIDLAIAACRPAMDTRLQTFSVSLPRSSIALDADPVALAQVLSNLLDNASRYTPVGGSIKLSLALVADALVIEVSDNGIGIAAEALQRIFQPFVREPNAAAFSSGGLGIGLSVVRELVEAHGGTVVATSAGADQGSQFTIGLPLSGR